MHIFAQASNVLPPFRTLTAWRRRLQVGADKNDASAWRDGVDQVQPRPDALVHDQFALGLVLRIHVVIRDALARAALHGAVVSDGGVHEQRYTPASARWATVWESGDARRLKRGESANLQM